MNKTILKSNNNEVVSVCESECSKCTCKTKETEFNFKFEPKELDVKRRNRGFEVVTNGHRKNIDKEIQLPVRGDSRSAGYDIRTPHEVTIKAGESVLIWTDVKAYMLDDEVLKVYVRSSIGTKKGLILKNVVGIIDSSYYGNIDNDGNIGVCLKNTTDKDVHLDEQERICQGVFQKYLIADDDVCLNNERTGGFGSSGTK